MPWTTQRNKGMNEERERGRGEEVERRMETFVGFRNGIDGDVEVESVTEWGTTEGRWKDAGKTLRSVGRGGMN